MASLSAFCRPGINGPIGDVLPPDDDAPLRTKKAKKCWRHSQQTNGMKTFGIDEIFDVYSVDAAEASLSSFIDTS